jgi:acetoin utilization deacetylase AcuC-like enzyme
VFSPSSIKHLENTELPDDYSRPWTAGKIKALASGMAVGTLMGVGGEVLFQNLLDIEKTFVLWGAVGMGIGWYLGGGKQVAEAEKPINGGYDRKLIADRPARITSVLASIAETNKELLPEISSSIMNRDLAVARKYARIVHTTKYVDMLETRSQQADRPERLNPVYSRTLIDQYSFDAALNAVADWIESVDNALAGKPPVFALVRPPGHHACRAKGMGGCLLNSAAIAAVYALDQPNVKSVAILDIDAHHGNGIAHCIQAIPGIRYCSIHEESSSGFMGRSRDDPHDPRSAASDDTGPLGNIRNINLPAGTTWDNGYREALEEHAILFLAETKPDIVVVAAGFDALGADLTSRLQLQPGDFRKISECLQMNFSNRIACGLEGGYCWQGGELAEAVVAFVEPFRHHQDDTG